MIDPFPNDIISDYFKNIRKLLYEADGRSYLPPKNPLDFKEVYNEGAREIIKSEPNKNSLIKLSPNKSFSEFLKYCASPINYKSELESYNKDFLKLPFNTIEISEEIEIDCYFYKYSFMDGKEELQDVNAPNISSRNFLMRRSDFLYMNIYSKFALIFDNYQKFIKRVRKQFQLNKKMDEENILHYFIKYYNDILIINDKQLKIFEHVKTTKQVADIYTKILIEFLTLRLNILLSITDKTYIAQPQAMSIDGKIVVELPENFSLIEQSINSEALDIRQTAILFYYLRKHHATIEYSDKSYAKLVHYLSGYSAENLRKRSGFGNISNIFKETRDGVKHSNLKNVRTLLKNIISDIDKEIKK